MTPPQKPEKNELLSAFDSVVERERVLDYFEKHRRLPMTLSEAGDVEEGVEYESSDNVQIFLESTGMKPAPRGQ